jgi:hypothetical protein
VRISSGARTKRSPGIAAVLTATVLSVVVGFAAVGTIPADAHELDLMTPDHAGPIVRNESTMGDLRGWFGAPTSRKVIEVGCQEVVSARWGHDLRVYAYRVETRTVGAIFVRSDTITSGEHGELSMHTRKGLQVEDREGKLRRLYPRSRPLTHAQHTHYRLREDDFGARLMAKVVDRRVVQLESWPLEFC